MGKEYQKGKSFTGRFLHADLLLQHPAPSHQVKHRPVTAPAMWSLQPGAHLSVPSLPPNSPVQRPCVADDTDSDCRASSHHLESAITTGQLLPRLRAVLDRPIPSLTEASRHPAAPADCCQGHCTTMMPAPSTRRKGLTQHLCFFLPYCNSVRASSRSPPSFLGTCRHRALVSPCVPRGHAQRPPYPAHHLTPAYGQNPRPSRVLNSDHCHRASVTGECMPALPPHQAVTSLYGPALL
jgi:hypothetical protein